MPYQPPVRYSVPRIIYIVPGDSRSLQVEGEVFERAAELLRRSPEFTVLATLRQEPANSGTILSFSHGYNRYTHRLLAHILWPEFSMEVGVTRCL